jgi:hypothetical protein
MISRRITAADVSFLTGFSRHQLRNLLRVLPGFDERAEQARIAREYSPQDLSILLVCCELELHYGLRRDAIGTLVNELRKTMSGPRSVASNARLVFRVSPPSVEYVNEVVNIEDGLVFPLGGIFQRIDDYLATFIPPEWGNQRTLDLGIATIMGINNHNIRDDGTNLVVDRKKSRRAT